MFWFCLIGFVGIVIAGVVGHFIYDALCRNKWIAWAVPVNESTWEHLKLAVMPMILWYLIGLVAFKFNNYDFGVFVAIVLSCVLIPVIFYTYTEFAKKSIPAVDISSYFVAVALSCLTAYNIFKAQPLSACFNILGKIGIIMIFVLFVVFTYYTPKFFLFQDPTNQKYGLDARRNLPSKQWCKQ